MSFEEVRCSACGAREARTVCSGRDRLHGRAGHFSVVECERCGLMRTTPRPTRAQLSEYYPTDYHPYASEVPGKWRGAVRRLLGDDTPVPPQRAGRLLEIGAASGTFLLQMQQRGWEVTGLEWDAAAAARAAERTGARVAAGDAAEASFPPEAFDLVCAWMVLEHLEEPRQALERIWQWLRPGGWLAFSVPDAGGWQFRRFGGDWYALDLPRHLHHFTVPLLGGWLTSIGYEPPAVRWQPTLSDVPMSLAFWAESRLGRRAGRVARSIATSLPSRGLARALGRPAAALRLTGRLTIWARKP